MNVDKVNQEIKNLKNSQDDKYYDELYLKIKKILDGDYPEKEKERIRNTGRVSTIYMLSTFSKKGSKI